jgi:hypothetical protein
MAQSNTWQALFSEATRTTTLIKASSRAENQLVLDVDF